MTFSRCAFVAAFISAAALMFQTVDARAEGCRDGTECGGPDGSGGRGTPTGPPAPAPACGHPGEPCCSTVSCYEGASLVPVGESRYWPVACVTGTCRDWHAWGQKCSTDYWLAQASGGGTFLTCALSPVCAGAAADFWSNGCGEDNCAWSQSWGNNFNPTLSWMGSCPNKSGISAF